jgi:hypothetical protein
MHKKSFLFQLHVLLSLAFVSGPLTAQSLGEFTEFHRLLRVNAREEVVLCYPSETPVSEPLVYATHRDSLGRVAVVTRFFFGNIDPHAVWTTMRITYQRNDSTKIQAQRRRYFSANGQRVPYGGGWGEDIISRTNGELLYRRLVDEWDEPMKDVPIITMSMYHDSAATIFQEWRFGNGKQVAGAGVGADHPVTSFAPLPAEAYFRRYQVDSSGNLIREEALSFERQQISFPRGEIMRQYELNDCGLPVRISYLDGEAQPMADSQGIASEQLIYDDYGRVVEWHAYNADGKPQGRGEDGAATIKLNYRNFDGILLGQELFDVEGKPVASRPRQ